MHAKRWITGLIALPFLVFLIVKGGAFFSVFIGAVALVAQWEYARIAYDASLRQDRGVVARIAFISTALIVWAAHRQSTDLMLFFIALNLLGAGAAAVFQFKHQPGILRTVRWQILGILYIPTLLGYTILLRSGAGAEGARWLFFFLCLVFAGDIGALYVGTFWGRRKLCPAVSPKKTVEGAVGGLLANVLVGVSFKLLFMPQLPWGMGFLFFFSIGIAGQLGDLFESGFKRAARIKDSGGLLPGHGGILDRADAVLFAAPVAYFFKEFLF